MIVEEKVECDTIEAESHQITGVLPPEITNGDKEALRPAARYIAFLLLRLFPELTEENEEGRKAA